jgi:hypothetical protein
MAKTFRMEETLEFPRDKVLALVTDAAVKKAETIEIGGALEAEAVKENLGVDRVRMVVRSKVYSRGMDGKKDMTRTEEAVFDETWDLKRFESDWTYRMGATFGDKVKVGGRKRLAARGANACTYIDEISVNVDIPIIGAVIAGKVISSLERGQPRLMEWMKKKLDER